MELIPPTQTLKNGILYTGPAEERLQLIESESIDFVLTSPPYDKLRSYQGYTLNWKAVARELTRVIKPGGVIVWVVGDATVNGSETGSSFRQVLYFRDKCKLRLHDTMMFAKNNPIPGDHGPRYRGAFEYMFAFSKGKPVTFNPLKWKTTERIKYFERFRLEKDGRVNEFKTLDNGHKEAAFDRVITEAAHPNIFFYTLALRRQNKELKHTAVFPDQLAEDQIRTWTNPGDTVLDCFVGSGTTAIAAERLGRKYIGIDISDKYISLAGASLLEVELGLPVIEEAEEISKAQAIELDFE